MHTKHALLNLSLALLSTSFHVITLSRSVIIFIVFSTSLTVFQASSLVSLTTIKLPDFSTLLFGSFISSPIFTCKNIFIKPGIELVSSIPTISFTIPGCGINAFSIATLFFVGIKLWGGKPRHISIAL